MDRPFSLKKLLRSLGYAVNGLKAAFRAEQNFRLHTMAALLAVLLSFFLKITAYEWLIIILCIVGVMALELVNTSIEKICDRISPEKHPQIKYIKDAAAAAVLIVAAGAFIAGLVIFLPRLMKLL
ncbi:MAG TPA: diacylglycerol kinase family protein [Niabella sp.]